MSNPDNRRAKLFLAGLALLLSSGCSEPYLGVKIPFQVSWGGDALVCEGGDIRLNDLRFHVSEVQLVDAEGHATRLALHADIPWQQADVAMIDLESGAATCSGGTADTYPYLVGGVPPGDYRGLRFTIGVPFEQNHANPLLAAAPLDDPAMHWHWRSGYKFLRAGVQKGEDGFWIHVGSAGCEGTVGNITGCRFPNRITVQLDGYTPNADTIDVDLKSLFADIDLDDGLPGDCSSGPAEPTCNAPFAALGLDFDTGAAGDRQRVFSIRR